MEIVSAPAPFVLACQMWPSPKSGALEVSDLEPQVKRKMIIFSRHGVKIRRSTIYDWLSATADVVE